MRHSKIPDPRPQREIPTYQTPSPATPTAINNTAGVVITTLGQNITHPSGRKGRCLPFWLNKELREKRITGAESPVERVWELDTEEK